jgi:RNA polymerase sigma-70 factor (ECF subfamily)
MTAEQAATERTVFVGDGASRAKAGRRADEGSRGPLRKPDFERLYEEHARQLLAFLVYRTGDRMLAEDLLADTFERVLRAKRRFDPGRGSEKTWLYTIALNCLRDNARRVSAETRALERSGGSDSPYQRSHDDGLADQDLLRRCMATLSDDERLVLSLRYGADLTMPEIAKVTSQPLTTVEGRVYRALGKLRDGIEAS